MLPQTIVYTFLQHPHMNYRICGRQSFTSSAPFASSPLPTLNPFFTLFWPCHEKSVVRIGYDLGTRIKIFFLFFFSNKLLERIPSLGKRACMSVAEQMKLLRFCIVPLYLLSQVGTLGTKATVKITGWDLGPCSLSHIHTLVAYLEFSGGDPVQIF